jgi:ABC-type nickel/cobalt efflux system permease component RcnA
MYLYSSVYQTAQLTLPTLFLSKGPTMALTANARRLSAHVTLASPSKYQPTPAFPLGSIPIASYDSIFSFLSDTTLQHILTSRNLIMLTYKDKHIHTHTHTHTNTHTHTHIHTYTHTHTHTDTHTRTLTHTGTKGRPTRIPRSTTRLPR